MKNLVLVGGAVAAFSGLAGTTAMAGGFAMPANSTSGMMTSFAGVTAFGYDPSFQIYNPATLADLSGRQTTVDLKGFFPSANIDATSATAPIALGGGSLIGLGDSGEMTKAALAPTAFGSLQLSDRFTAGVGVYSPFAVVIDTSPTWAGQYQLLSTKMAAYDVQLGGAYQVNNWLALGAGVNVEYFDADLRRLEFVGGGASAVGFVKGSDVGVGFDLGLTITPSDRTRIGVSYRSAIDHILSGTAGVVVAPTQGALTSLTMPDSLTVGVAQRVTDSLTLLADVGWTGWSEFDGLRIDLASSPDQVRSEDWRDTWHAALGLRYKIDPDLTLTGGVLYDQGVAKGATNTLSPDGDRLQLSIGLEKRLSDKVRMAVAVSHMRITEAPIAVTEASGGNAGSSLAGVFKSNLTAVGMNITVDW